jgi:hypothetical protein
VVCRQTDLPGLRFLDTAGVDGTLPNRANERRAVAAYRCGEDGAQRAFARVVLSATTSGIARITRFNDTDLFTSFDFPPVVGIPSVVGVVATQVVDHAAVTFLAAPRRVRSAAGPGPGYALTREGSGPRGG